MITDTRTLRAQIGRTVQVDGYRGGTLVEVTEDDETIYGLVQFRSGHAEWQDALDIELIY